MVIGGIIFVVAALVAFNYKWLNEFYEREYEYVEGGRDRKGAWLIRNDPPQSPPSPPPNIPTPTPQVASHDLEPRDAPGESASAVLAANARRR